MPTSKSKLLLSEAHSVYSENTAESTAQIWSGKMVTNHQRTFFLMGLFHANQTAAFAATAIELCIQKIERAIREQTADNLVQILSEALEEANSAVYLYLSTKSAAHASGFGLSVTLLAVYQNRLYVVSVGANRVLLLRQKQISPLTIQHIWSLHSVKQGLLPVDAPSNKPLKKGQLLRAIGFAEDVEVDYGLYLNTDAQNMDKAYENQGMLLQTGDRIVLASVELFSTQQNYYLQDVSLTEFSFVYAIAEEKIVVEKLVGLALKQGQSKVACMVLDVKAHQDKIVAIVPPVVTSNIAIAEDADMPTSISATPAGFDSLPTQAHLVTHPSKNNELSADKAETAHPEYHSPATFSTDKEIGKPVSPLTDSSAQKKANIPLSVYVVLGTLVFILASLGILGLWKSLKPAELQPISMPVRSTPQPNFAQVYAQDGVMYLENPRDGKQPLSLYSQIEFAPGSFVSVNEIADSANFALNLPGNVLMYLGSNSKIQLLENPVNTLISQTRLEQGSIFVAGDNRSLKDYAFWVSSPISAKAGIIGNLLDTGKMETDMMCVRFDPVLQVLDVHCLFGTCKLSFKNQANAFDLQAGQHSYSDSTGWQKPDSADLNACGKRIYNYLPSPTPLVTNTATLTTIIQIPTSRDPEIPATSVEIPFTTEVFPLATVNPASSPHAVETRQSPIPSGTSIIVQTAPQNPTSTQTGHGQPGLTSVPTQTTHPSTNTPVLPTRTLVPGLTITSVPPLPTNTPEPPPTETPEPPPPTDTNW